MGSVTSIAVNFDGDHIASSSADGTIRLWHIQSESCLRIMTPPGPYAGMDITGATGLTPAQVAALQTLGAVSDNH
jgi:WD40 repeat protein